ncbi:MAG: hypothetical protein ACNS61_05905 [Candidatus Wenzhouxiangella sp. M2_3B_020]
MRQEHITHAPDTTDLERALRLSRMKTDTRTATIQSLRFLRDATGTDGRLTVDEVEALAAAPGPDLRAALGARATQVLSDAKRALRKWNDPATRWLALRLAGPVPRLDTAVEVAHRQLSADEARRVEVALEALADSEGTTVDQLPATAAALEPLLRAATPETFGVASLKSLDNKRGLVRKGVRLVDLSRTGARESDVRALPPVWRTALDKVTENLKDHEKSPRAICRRLALFANYHGEAPDALSSDLVTAFVAQERATHAGGYDEKLRAAFARWNRVAKTSRLTAIAMPVARRHRQDDVRWQVVPEAIRQPLDARLAGAISVKSTAGDWGAFVPDDDPDYDAEYAELGLGSAPPPAAALVLQHGSAGNWRDAVKRVWHAAMQDARVSPKPGTFADLFDIACARAAVAAARHARRQRLEAEGRLYDKTKKGRYEHSLIEAFCSAGRAVGIDPAQLEPIEELKRSIDPKIVGWKVAKDGARKAVYADRKIGPRHAEMLAAFADETALKRWFEAPSTLWRAACKPIEEGRKPGQTHVALARSALIARIGQYVAPLRRTNFARLRHDGNDRHLLLPIGAGEGTLRIPPGETKTMAEIHVRIDRETVRMVRFYIKHFLPVARKTAKAAPGNPHLFPGAGGGDPDDGGYAAGFGFLTKAKLNNIFRRHLWKHCKLTLCIHVMRHLAGKIILDQDPSALELVKTLLGHKRLETTRSYYAEVCALVAQRRYLHLLEKGARRVLADVRFRFVDVDTGRKPRRGRT